MHAESWEPLYILCQLKKPFKGLRQTSELMGGMEEKSISLTTGHWLPSRQINDFFNKKETAKYCDVSDLSPEPSSDSEEEENGQDEPKKESSNEDEYNKNEEGYSNK